MSGSESIQQIRSRGHTLPVIAVTANSMAQDVQSCMSIGFSGFLSKPCRKEQVKQIIKQFHEEGHQHACSSRPASGAISRRVILSPTGIPASAAAAPAATAAATATTYPSMTPNTHGQIVASFAVQAGTGTVPSGTASGRGSLKDAAAAAATAANPADVQAE
jgi:CheY-like chemotaxis protein